METVTEKLSNGNVIEYQIVNGTAYHKETPAEVVRALEDARKYGTRLLLEYGDTKTGKGWGDVHDVTGTVGRSTGAIKVPLLVHNRRSMGGGAILDHCIVSIQFSRRHGGAFIYRHPNYVTGRYQRGRLLMPLA
jgi:hypothetical protein